MHNSVSPYHYHRFPGEFISRTFVRPDEWCLKFGRLMPMVGGVDLRSNKGHQTHQKTLIQAFRYRISTSATTTSINWTLR